MPRVKKKVLTVVVSLVMIVSFTIFAVAWFAGVKDIGSVNFKPTTNAMLPKLDMWMYHSKNDFTNETETEGWVSQPIGEDLDNFAYLTIPGVVQQEQGTDLNGNKIYSYELSSLHFGKVDNLVTLSEDNKVLLRFFFDRTMLNNTKGTVHKVTFTLAYNTEGYTYEQNKTSIFDSIHLLKEVEGKNATEVNLKIPANQEAINEAESAGQTPPDKIYVLEYREDEPGAMQFLQMRYAISTTECVPGAEGFEFTENGTTQQLVLSAPLPINCGSAGMLTDETETVIDENGDPVVDADGNPVTAPVPVCRDCAAGVCGQIILENKLDGILETLEDGSGYDIGDGFYVYIELAPLLDAFGMQENILDYFVPAYMFFDIKLDVEIG